jgi:hypothetical protein
MASTSSKLSSTKDDATLDGNIAKHSSAYQNRRNSAYLENEAKAEKDLEKEIPAYDESKILEGRRLFFRLCCHVTLCTSVCPRCVFSLIGARDISFYILLEDQTIIAPAL